jgi:hypothetical protein
MSIGDVLEVIQGLGKGNFYKSTTTYSDNRMWQDVYHAEWKNKFLYVKIQQLGGVSTSSYRSRRRNMSTKWNGKPCPSCGNGILNHGVKKTAFDYRGKSFEYE